MSEQEDRSMNDNDICVSFQEISVETNQIELGKLSSLAYEEVWWMAYRIQLNV